MPRIPALRLPAAFALLLALLGPPPLAAQGIDPGDGGSIEPPGGGVEDLPGRAEPGDVSGGRDEDDEEEDETPFHVFATVQGVGPIPVQGARPPLMPRRPKGPRAPLPPDTSDWIWWWRLQRFDRLDPPVRPEPAPPVTPGAGRAAVPPPVHPPGNGLHPAWSEVLDLLLATWRQEPEEAELRAALLISLARVAPPSRLQDERVQQVDEALRQGLATRDRRVHEAAALALGIRGRPHDLPRLLALLEDRPEGRRAVDGGEVDERTRAFAAYALGLQARRLPFPELRAPVAEALLGLLRRGEGATDDLPAACVQALGQFPGEDAETLVPELLAVLRDTGEREHVRGQVPLSLARLLERARSARRAGGLSRSVFLDLRRRLLDRGENAAVRQSCALALGRLGRDPALAEEAARALIEIRSRPGDGRTRRLAALGLAEVATSSHAAAQTLALPALLDALRQGTDTDRGWAALALGWAGIRAADLGRPLPGAVARELRAALPRSGRPRLTAALSLALGLTGVREAAPEVARVLTGVGDPLLRGEAVAGLALLGGPVAAETVPRELERLDPLVEAFQAACAGLAHREPEALVQWLLAWLESGQDGPSYQARYAAAFALGWTSSPRAVPWLGRLLADGQPNAVRIAAAQSLGRLAERPGPRWNSGYLDLLNPWSAPPTLIGRPERPGVCDRF